MKEVKDNYMKQVSAYGYSEKGGRPENEDAGGMYQYHKNMVAIVADGLGGQGDGSIASVTALEMLVHCGESGELPDATEILHSFDNANKAILQKQSNGFHMKTTAVYLCIHENKAVWAHIGDSRMYHFFNNELVHVTLDHSVSQFAVVMGEIERKDIPTHTGRNRLLKALGCEDMEPEIEEAVDLQTGRHAFLLCTDGFWEYLDDRELGELLAEAPTAEEWITSARRQIAVRCGTANDNNTAMALIMEV